MATFAIHYELLDYIHEIQIKSQGADALRQVVTLSAQILSSEPKHHYLLIDATEAKLLPLRLLASELKRISRQSGNVGSSIAIVIHNKAFSDEMSIMIKTILERDNVELFTLADKARLWLEVQQKRHMSRHF